MISELLKFTTIRGDGDKTLDEWRWYLREVFYGHDVYSRDNEFIAGSLETRVFAEIGVVRHAATSHTICRTKELVKSDKAEKHAFVFPMSGRYNCFQGGREISVAAGAVYILNASEPFEVHTDDGASSVAITLPSDVCRLAIRGIDDKFCRTSIADPALVGAVVGFANGIIDRGTDADDLWLRDMCCHLLDGMVNTRHGAAHDGSWATSSAARRLMLDEIRRTIRQRLPEPDFRLADLASFFQLSPRHVQAVLQSVGSTFSHELLEARLRHAADLLRSPVRGPMQIGQIARACGFRNQAHFAKRYKDRFGIVPRDESPSTR